MSLTEYFVPLFTSEAGKDIQSIIREIQINPNQNYYVDAKGYDEDILHELLKNLNCTVIFHQDDEFSHHDRIQFVDRIPPFSNTNQIVVVSKGFNEDKLKEYARKNIRVFIVEITSGISQLILIAQQNIEIIPSGFTEGQVQDFRSAERRSYRGLVDLFSYRVDACDNLPGQGDKINAWKDG